MNHYHVLTIWTAYNENRGTWHVFQRGIFEATSMEDAQRQATRQASQICTCPYDWTISDEYSTVLGGDIQHFDIVPLPAPLVVLLNDYHALRYAFALSQEATDHLRTVHNELTRALNAYEGMPTGTE
jgi:hypothetical protein